MKKLDRRGRGRPPLYETADTSGMDLGIDRSWLNREVAAGRAFVKEKHESANEFRERVRREKAALRGDDPDLEREARAQSKSARTRRIRQTEETLVRTTVTISRDTIDMARKIGNGNLSLGLRHAVLMAYQTTNGGEIQVMSLASPVSREDDLKAQLAAINKRLDEIHAPMKTVRRLIKKKNGAHA